MYKAWTQKVRRVANANDRWLYKFNIKSTNSLSLPDFLGLGPGQSGSTWLFEQLSHHPEVFIPPKKEINYFNRNLHNYPLTSYTANFKHKSNLVTGEISPGYSVLRQDRIKYLHRVMPNARLILTVRNPIERSWSAARRVLMRLNMSLEEFGDTEFFSYLSKEWAYRSKNGDRVIGDYELDLLEGQYSKVIKNWLNYFPKEQLLVVFFQQLKEDPEAYLKEVCAHIGVSTQFQWDPRQLRSKVNPNPTMEIPERFRIFLEQQYKDEIVWLKEQFGSNSIS